VFDTASDPGSRSAGGRSGRIQAVDRAIALLRAVADLPAAEATLQRVADDAGLNRSTAWRILATLADHGMVERRDGGYAIGMAAVRFSNAASVDGFVRRAQPVIVRLADTSGETANLAVVRRFRLYYAEQVSSKPEVPEEWLGRSIPLHATSAGKAYLAALPDDEVRDLVPVRLPRHTRSTILTRAALLEELRDIRARGYACVTGELEPDTNGVAAAVCDAAGRPVAVATVWGDAHHLPVTRFGPLGSLVMAAAGQLRLLLTGPFDDG